MNLQRAGNERGFTLLELIVVGALIGIMLSLSVPSLRRTFFTDPLKSTTRNLIGLVTGVRELAVNRQKSYLLHISEAEKRIWYEEENSQGILKGEDRREKEVKIPETVRISGVWIGDGEASSLEDQTVIWISKKGYIQRTRIRIEDDDGKHLLVQFYPFLDAATVDE